MVIYGQFDKGAVSIAPCCRTPLNNKEDILSKNEAQPIPVRLSGARHHFFQNVLEGKQTLAFPYRLETEWGVIELLQYVGVISAEHGRWSLIWYAQIVEHDGQTVPVSERAMYLYTMYIARQSWPNGQLSLAKVPALARTQTAAA
jgi:hypothetical protein